jgi:environmental stress-induced protein Ves
MAVRILEPGDYREMPWKNGGGSTTELLIAPPGATLAGGFDWRVSMAAVPASGPFSSFPGIDRTLLLVAGDGLELDHGPHGRALLPGPWIPAAFSGDWATEGRLLGGPCRDFNVMTDRARWRHRVTLLRPGPDPAFLPEAPVLLVFCARGEVRVGAGRRLGEGRSLYWRNDGDGPLAVAGTGDEPLLVAVELWPVAAGTDTVCGGV